MSGRTDIRTLEQQVGRRLLLWSGFSILSGLGLWLRPPFWRGVGQQFVAWGVIDAAIALFGRWQARRRQAGGPMPETPADLAQAARSLRRLLWINTGLDVLYVVGGLALIRRRGAADERWRGHGVGIVIQGGFLLLFDLFHAVRVPHPDAETHDV